jgi:hypothetical protein
VDLGVDGSLEREEDMAEAYALLSTLPSPTPDQVRALNRAVADALETFPPAAREASRRRRWAAGLLVLGLAVLALAALLAS